MHYRLKANRLEVIPEFRAAMMFGYGVYTSFLLTPGLGPEPVLSPHLERLCHDAAAMDIRPSFDAVNLMAALQAFMATRSEPVAVRLTLVPAIDGLTYLFAPEALPGTLLVSFRNPPQPAAPLKLATADFERPWPTIKHIGTGPIFMFKRQAIRQGFDDILTVNHQGHITEAATANVFVIRDNILYTPDPDRDGCLPGIMRHQVLSAAAAAGWAVSNEPLPAEWFSGEQALTDTAAFLTNAVSGIIPVGRINQCRLVTPLAQHIERLARSICPGTQIR